ncbi:MULTISPECIES: hypothetical protein [unclassified Bacillus (in: firmicutes)]|uniref:hypothetical protein n=1 Tax=unclassified Bacillus (in: firmicutes) TaxID=185979 RepID=UPI0020363393|nr:MULTISPECIES: hypothetical protein [unclassified Bacillus (in: firmicutes)]
MLSPVSVAINKQGQDIGTYMLQEGIKLAAKKGFKGIIVEGICVQEKSSTFF